jgi:hypothetical protein
VYAVASSPTVFSARAWTARAVVSAMLDERDLDRVADRVGDFVHRVGTQHEQLRSG